MYVTVHAVLYMYMYMQVHVGTCGYMAVHVGTCGYMVVHVGTCGYMGAYMWVHVQLYVHACYIHVIDCACTYIHTCSYLHTVG